MWRAQRISFWNNGRYCGSNALIGSIRIGRSSQLQIRSFSDFYLMKAQEGNQDINLRVPVLKAPTHFGHYSSRVNRPYNEDRYFAGVLKLPIGSSFVSKKIRKKKDGGQAMRQVFNFAVFDGHGGSECSEFLQENLATYVEDVDLNSGEKLKELYKANIGGYWRRWRGELEKYIAKMNASDDLQLRLPMAFLTADYDFTREHPLSGSTCTSIYMYTEEPNKAFWDQNQTTHLAVAHVGDTRCIICDRFGEAHPLTSNHHPSSPIEATRLRRYTASFFTDSFGEERFGSFANTRSFGDLPAKSKGVTAEPDIIEYQIGNPHVSRQRTVGGLGGDEAFLVLVSDGVSGVVSDQEMIDIVINTANSSGSGRGTPQDAAMEIVRFAEAMGTDDNATCLVVRLNGWGKWPQGVDRTGEMRESRLRDALDNRSRRM